MSDNQTSVMTTSTTIRSKTTAAFPAAEVQKRLRREVGRVADDLSAVRSEWEPNLDSLAIVGVVVVLRDLFPFAIAPEKIVKKGGYRSVDEAVQDMTERLERQWNKHQ